MAIVRKPNKMTVTTPAVLDATDAFIAGAPDATASVQEQAAPSRVRKGNKVQITLTIAEPLLDRVDEMAKSIGQSRAAVINLAVMQVLQQGLRLQGQE